MQVIFVSSEKQGYLPWPCQTRTLGFLVAGAAHPSFEEKKSGRGAHACYRIDNAFLMPKVACSSL